MLYSKRSLTHKLITCNSELPCGDNSGHSCASHLLDDAGRSGRSCNSSHCSSARCGKEEVPNMHAFQLDSAHCSHYNITCNDNIIRSCRAPSFHVILQSLQRGFVPSQQPRQIVLVHFHPLYHWPSILLQQTAERSHLHTHTHTQEGSGRAQA